MFADFPVQGKDKREKSRWEVDQSWLNFTNQQKALIRQRKGWQDDIRTELGSFCLSSLCSLAKSTTRKRKRHRFLEISYKK